MGNKKYLKIIALLLPLLLIATLFYTPQSRELGLTVSFLDVGQGDATYVKAPNGNDVLIDAGPRGKLKNSLEDVMGLGDRDIDIFILTNPDADHFAGILDILDTYSIGLVIESGTISTTKTYKEFKKKIDSKNIPSIVLKSRTTIILDKDKNIFLDIIFPNKDISSFSRNDGSIISILNFGDAKYIFTGDTTSKTESMLLNIYPEEVLNSDILKVAHHGSRTSSSKSFLEKVSPDISFISAGLGNTYGHPHPEVYLRLKNISKTVYVSKDDGTIICESFGGEPICLNQKQE